jgi:hypothetical protein
MALITDLKPRETLKDSRHTKADATYSIVTDSGGTKLLQIDTYGSKTRRFQGKLSQSIRFSPAALDQLRRILKEKFEED